ncbi:hypothetical protein K437DRAFT_253655 [Tilletiaria anomala UBC 951]|uniref:Cation/H+ exchanger transmembrane domain-containing protein n=1 Tax=Tilletiaria anomala (strain ATCC 24038 / CBS 436.72 / UBC 951) TaxID=1037660 RepID=A0A066WPS8_TILAU|nr:uncharacterized protein K437DRAFT_253655 [Tilletiaria anomala UBC 951]KDN53004.1 hypothetical protein K437DRAFT_253655 [Tilletiaria anomala UBC 951]
MFDGPRYLAMPRELAADTASAMLLAARAAQGNSTSGGAHSDSIISGIDPTAFETSNPLRLFIIQAVIIIVFTRLLGWGLAYVRQPRVIAEVLGGILLGPTVFGRIPGFSQHIFPQQSLPFLNLVSTLGLVLFLFLVGVEVDLRAVKKCYKEAVSIGVVGMIFPFGLGAAVSVGIYRDLIHHDTVSLGHFILFTGVAMAITAFPVLARILTETRLTQTKVGVIVLAAGVSNDVVGWILLALTVALVNASSGLTALWVLLTTVAWALVLFLLIKPAFIWFARRIGAFENGPNQVMMTVTLLLVFASAWLTDVIGVHPIFGSFLVGLMIPHDGGFAVAMFEKIEDLVAVLFLPIYFALSGLKTNLASLDNGTVWGYLIAIIAIAFTSKFGACAAAARWCGLGVRESLAVGTLMSCKGLVELIVLNIGLSAGILDTRTFSMFVVMALVSTVATTPLTLLAYPERLRTYLHDAPSAGAAASKSASAGAGAAADKGVRDGADQEEDEDDEGSAALCSNKRLLVVLDKFDHLPGLMTLVQLIKPSEAPLRRQNTAAAAVVPSSATSSAAESSKDADADVDIDTSREAGEAAGAEKDGATKDAAVSSATPVLRSDAPHHAAMPDASGSEQPQADISIDALRLIELTDRTSAVMKLSESDDTMRADPILNVFRTFGHLNRLPVRSSIAVVPTDEYSATVVARACNVHSNLVVVPWTVAPSGRPAAGEQQQQVSNPFENIFGRVASAAAPGSGDSASASDRRSPHQANFVRKVFQTAACDVGVLLTRPANSALATAGAAAAQHNNLLVGFFGGPDDRAALALSLRLCASNPDLHVTVLRFRRTEPGSGDGEASGSSNANGGDLAVPSIPPTLHHAQSLHHVQGAAGNNNHNSIVQDTMYPSNFGQTPMEATLADDLAITKAQELSASFSERFAVREIRTPRVLRDLVLAVEAEQPTVVIVGRGRKAPAMTHREELRFLLVNGTLGGTLGVGVGAEDATRSALAAAAASSTKERQLNSETCKVVGEPAMALTLARTTALTLVLASSVNSSGSSQQQQHA